jgi:hypothetical protein
MRNLNKKSVPGLTKTGSAWSLPHTACMDCLKPTCPEIPRTDVDAQSVLPTLVASWSTPKRHCSVRMRKWACSFGGAGGTYTLNPKP